MDKILYGKNYLERIVSIEVQEDSAEIFLEHKDGKIESRFIPNKFWLLADNKSHKSWLKMDGDLPYKYGKQFATRDEFERSYYPMKHRGGWGIWNKEEALMVKDGYTYFKGMKHTEVSVLSFDIETNGLNMDSEARIFLISNTYRGVDGNPERKLFSYDEYEDEGKMLEAWCEWVREKNPTIMLGHNIYTFDLPFMDHVAALHGIQLDLGRDGSPLKFDSYDSKFRRDATQFYYYKAPQCYGREFLDTMFLAVKADPIRKYPSYGLKQLIEFEGLQVEGRQFYDAGQIRHNYKDPVEWNLIKIYALHDADDSLALYDLMSPAFFYMSQMIPKTYQTIMRTASGSQLNSMMVRSYLQDRGSLPKALPAERYEGAISFGNPGIYSNVFKIDVASLYPSIMIQYEVFNETKDPKGYFKHLVETLTKERLENKAKAKTDPYYEDLQQAQKIMINSLYGFLGANGLLFNSPDKAAFITEKGREILTIALDWAKEKGFTIVNADTDSISFSKDSEFTPEEQESLLVEINALCPEKIIWEDDGTFRKVVVIKAKNYILDDGKKVKYKGSAIKATSKEPALQQFIKDLVEAMLNGKENFVEIYNTYVLEALDVKDIERWASKHTVTEAVLKPKRTQEEKKLAALQGKEFQQGDKFYAFFREDESMCLAEDFDGDYNVDKLLEKIFKTTKVFETVIPKGTFINYKLKRSKEALNELATQQTAISA